VPGKVGDGLGVAQSERLRIADFFEPPLKATKGCANTLDRAGNGFSAPRPTDTMAITAATPITMPIIVSPERILLAESFPAPR